MLRSGDRFSVWSLGDEDASEAELIRRFFHGNARLVEVRRRKDAIYAKGEFSEEDGVEAAALESEFAELGVPSSARNRCAHR